MHKSTGCLAGAGGPLRPLPSPTPTGAGRVVLVLMLTLGLWPSSALQLLQMRSLSSQLFLTQKFLRLQSEEGQLSRQHR